MGISTGKIIYFITGASGTGKTTLVSRLKKKYKDMPWAFLHFDSIGVPSLAEMEKEFGSPSDWQEAKTYEWIKSLLTEHHHEKIFFEGQVNLQFIHRSFEKHHFKNYIVILIDCSEEVMGYRLTGERAQPELFNKDMRNWLKYLRNQAKESGVAVIDTSNLSVEDTLVEFEEIAGL